MKRKIDYIIYSSNNERIVFRFYPRQSHVHSFDDNPPSSWRGVYKTYFAYSILHQWRWSPDSSWISNIVYKETCDECSVLDEIPMVISEILNKDIENDFTMIPLGMGTSWDWKYKPSITVGERITSPAWTISLWRWDNVGYKFTLEEKQLIEFKEYLDYVLDYMLKHGEGI